jgi:hypothetical protein
VAALSGHNKAAEATSIAPSYIFFSEQVLVALSHVPPALAQSAAVFAVFTSWAKAGPVKAIARVTARTETRLFMTFSPLRWYQTRRMEKRDS